MFSAFDTEHRTLHCALKMRVWVKLELLCIHFDGWQVNFDTWPIPFSQFKEIIIGRALEHFEESSCIFIVDELHKLRGDLTEISSVLHEKCRFFIRRGRENPTEIENLSTLQTDDDIFLCVGDWSGGYDTEMVSDSDDDVESWGGWLIEGEKIVLAIACLEFLACTLFLYDKINYSRYP